ncbi:MAG: ribonucleotide reductase N-terminal alpha domain-containing protein [Ktedonobacterales bacterium]
MKEKQDKPRYATGETNSGAMQATQPNRAARAAQATSSKATPRTTGQWSETALRVLRERYLLKDETGKVIESPDELCWRVASAVAEAEKSWHSPDEVQAIIEQFYNVMATHQFLPNSPTLMNAGKGNNLQLSACYVVPVEDSLSGIFESVKHAALIHQSGGGTGMSFSRLRPAGSMVASTHGVASGPISFMKIFDGATEAVKQGGTRRGANMGVLRVDHPDILHFINCKRDGSVTNFNISVGVTDTFMRAYEADDEYDLVDPHTHEVTQRLRAREVMNQIIDAAWSTGDPGLIFLDRVNRSPANPTPELEQIETTNPCVIGETRLATDRGLVRMDTLYASGEQLIVATDARALAHTVEAAVNGVAQVATSGVTFQSAVPVFQTGKQVPVRKLITSHGIEITATPNHRFLTTEGYKRLDHLEYGDTLLLQGGEGAWSQDRSLPTFAYGQRSQARLDAKVARGEAQPPTEWSAELGEVVGYVLGDGYVRREETTDLVGMAVDAQDVALADTLQARIQRWYGAAGNRTERQGHLQLMYRGSAGTLLMGLGVSSVRSHEKRVPESIFLAPRDAVIGFLRGLFSADGSVQTGPAEKGTCSVRLATSSKGLAHDVQQLLLNLGIVSVMRLRREAQVRLMPNAQREAAEYATQAQYEVIIDKGNRDRFAEVVGFMQARKQQALMTWIANKKRTSNYEPFTTQVALIEDAGVADVYDTTEPVTHSIVVNGIATHQCGEQPLGSYDACNLGSINLAQFVLPTTAGGAARERIDWETLTSVTQTCVRFLDNVIEVNPYPLPEVRDKVMSNRRIGLGIMGWADMLFKLGVRYDTEEAVTLGEEVMRFIQSSADDTSASLVGERGAFPNWEHSRYKDGRKLRNSNRTTVAPTGSISIIADCSSGIEPIFALAFQHRVKQPDGSYRVLDFVNPLFEEAVKQSHLSEGEQADLLTYTATHGSLYGSAYADDPAFAAYITAQEIAPTWHIRMQAAFQKGVDSAISKTVNMPNSATREDVADAYMQAWDLGCLGITVFRDGCKGEQVLNVGVKESRPAEQAAPAATESAVQQAEAAARQARARIYPSGVKTRPEVVNGYTRQVRAPEGKVNVTLNSDDDGLFEVFINIGKAGSDVAALAEALGRLISIHVQVDSPLSQDQRAAEVSRQLRSIGGSASIGFGPDRVRSLPDAIARALDLHLEAQRNRTSPAALPSSDGMGADEAADAEAAGATPNAPASQANGNGHGAALGDSLGMGKLALYSVTGNLCTQCGNNTMYNEEGCRKCVSCGYSEC